MALRMLRRFAPKVIINFDPDNAGQSAAERSSELLVEAGFSVNVLRLPGGDDPDTFVQGRGREAYYESYTLFTADKPRMHHFERQPQ